MLEPHQQLEQGSRGKRYTYTLTAYCLSSLQDNEIIRDDQPPWIIDLQEEEQKEQQKKRFTYEWSDGNVQKNTSLVKSQIITFVI